MPMSLPGAEATFAGLGDNVATIAVSSRGVSANILVGEVDNVDFDYTGRKIHASGRGIGAKLHENMTSEKFLNKKGSDIAKDFAGRVGLGFTGDASTLLHGKLLQQDYVKLTDNVSFAYIIQKCAELDNARWFVDNNGTLNYLSTSNPSGTYSINYAYTGLEVISDAKHLRVAKNVQAGKNIVVMVRSWHSKDKQAYEDSATVDGNGGPLNYFYDIPNLKKDHVKKHADSRSKEAARHRIRIDATVVGDPTCNVQMVLSVNGTSFAGTYEMDCVSHIFGRGGHITHITARSII